MDTEKEGYEKINNSNLEIARQDHAIIIRKMKMNINSKSN